MKAVDLQSIYRTSFHIHQCPHVQNFSIPYPYWANIACYDYYYVRTYKPKWVMPFQKLYIKDKSDNNMTS